MAVRTRAPVEAAERIAAPAALLGRILRAAVTRPTSWLGEAIEQIALMFTRVALPLAISVSAFIVGAGTILTLTVLEKIGGEDRYGFGIVAVGLREFNGWTTGMCVAGIAGTAICADLGARKVREELDAMAVLAVDPERMLVLPRFLALTIMTPVLYLWATVWSTLAAGLSGSVVADYKMSTFFGSVGLFLNADLVAGCIKMTIIGAAIGLVSCHKGITAQGGPAGVGRAVNQAVVLAFAATWVLNYVFNAFFLGAFPATQDLR